MQKRRAQILPKFSSCLVPPVDSITCFYSSRKRSAAEFTISSQKVETRVTGFVQQMEERNTRGTKKNTKGTARRSRLPNFADGFAALLSAVSFSAISLAFSIQLLAESGAKLQASRC